MTTPLAELTTLRVGAAPRALLLAATRYELIAAARQAWDDEAWFVLGGGSNTLAGDEPFDGTVVLVRSTGIEAREVEGHAVVTVQAGESWDALVATAVERGWAGIEALSGIPGTVGAAPVQNIGAYGQEIAHTVTAVEFLDYHTGEIEWIRGADLGLGYRASAFKPSHGEPTAERIGVVLAVEFRFELAAGLSAPIEFAQLSEALGVPEGERAPLQHVRETVLRLRASKGMVLDEGDPDSVSLGSFFINPIIPSKMAAFLPAEAPRYPIEPDEPDLVIPLAELAEHAHLLDAPSVEAEHHTKLSAAWLIEHAGITKGYAIPGSRAAVSSKHTLALTNRGGATAEEVAQLARLIQSRVQAEFGIWLEPEPVRLGVEL